MGKELLLIAIVMLSTNASAYIDPGTGGAIIGSMWAAIAGIIAIIGALVGRYFIGPIRKALSTIIKPKKKT